MFSIITDGTITIREDSNHDWFLLENKSGCKVFTPFSALDNETLKMVNERLENPTMPQEAKKRVQEEIEQRSNIREFRLIIVNSEENKDILNKCVVSWSIENETPETLEVVFKSESSRDSLKIALKRESSKSYPDIIREVTK